MLDLWLLVVLCVYSTLAQFMMNYGNDWDMYLVPSYVGTQIWGTASHHVLLLSSRKSCLMTSRGKLVHWWGSWEGAGGPGRAAAARRRRHRPPVLRPPAPPAGGTGYGGGSAGSTRGDGPRRRRRTARRSAELSWARLHHARSRQRHGAAGEAVGPARRAPVPWSLESFALLCACFVLSARLIYTSSQILYDPSSGAGSGCVPSIYICRESFFLSIFFVMEVLRSIRVLPM